ncbi:MAG: sugar ABC transporter permease, partial [Chloroflexi bacterium]|nr:sugar ABC transporter permease [Chloroflexota bacterium]
MAQSEIRVTPSAQPFALLVRVVGAHTPLQARRALWGYLFALPWVIGLLLFTIGPILASFYFSFTEYDIISDPRFVGLKNYRTAFFEDKL